MPSLEDLRKRLAKVEADPIRGQACDSWKMPYGDEQLCSTCGFQEHVHYKMPAHEFEPTSIPEMNGTACFICGIAKFAHTEERVREEPLTAEALQGLRDGSWEKSVNEHRTEIRRQSRLQFRSSAAPFKPFIDGLNAIGDVGAAAAAKIRRSLEAEEDAKRMGVSPSSVSVLPDGSIDGDDSFLKDLVKSGIRGSGSAAAAAASELRGDFAMPKPYSIQPGETIFKSKPFKPHFTNLQPGETTFIPGGESGLICRTCSSVLNEHRARTDDGFPESGWARVCPVRRLYKGIGGLCSVCRQPEELHYWVVTHREAKDMFHVCPLLDAPLLDAPLLDAPKPRQSFESKPLLYSSGIAVCAKCGKEKKEHVVVGQRHGDDLFYCPA